MAPPSWYGHGSQTFLSKADKCLHSAWLYKKHAGGAPSIPKVRGTLLHLVWERMLRTLQENGETTFYALQPGENHDHAKRNVVSMVEELVEQVREERLDLHVPQVEADAVRQMAYHLAVSMPVDPRKLIAVEGSYVIDIGGWEIRCRVDTAELDGDMLHIKDVKTSLHIPSDRDYADSFQRKMYSLAVLDGYPLDSNGERQERDPRLSGVKWVVGHEIYPRYLRDDYSIPGPSPVGMNRTDLHDFRVDLERLVATVDQLSRSDETWPAVAGHHCFQCPASHECPLPAGFRGPKGTEEGLVIEPIEIRDHEHASELAMTLHWHKEWGTALQRALRGFAKHNETSIRYGRDLELYFRRVNKDEGRKVETNFVRRRLSPDELENEGKEAA